MSDTQPMSAATAAKYQKPSVTRGVIRRFPRSLLYLAEVSAFGTRKHKVPLDDKGFLDVPDAEMVYLDALGRHLCQEAIGGPHNSDDDFLLHAGQAAWNALARLEVLLRKQKLETRMSGSTPEPVQARTVYVKAGEPEVPEWARNARGYEDTLRKG